MSLRTRLLATASAAALTLAASIGVAAGAAASTSPVYAAASGYQFASNTGQPGVAGSNDTYWRVASGPLSYKEASQSLAADGVDLSATPDTGTSYADSGVIVPLGTVAASGLLAKDGSLNLPAVQGSTNLAINIYFDTSGDGKYFAFNSDGVYTGLGGDTYVTTGGQPVPAATVTADENAKLAGATDIWAWVGIVSTTAGKTVTGNVYSVAGSKLVTVIPATGKGDLINTYGNGLDVRGQAEQVNTRIIVWPVTGNDPAVRFLPVPSGNGWAFEYDPAKPSNLCVSEAVGSEPAGSAQTGLVLRVCNGGPWQRFRVDLSGGSSQLVNAATGHTVQPNGTGAQMTGVTTVTNGPGSWFAWNKRGVPASS